MENNLSPSRLYRDVPFEGIEIRKIWHEEQWFFSIVDVIEILTDSKDPSDYWTTLKRRENQLPSICRKFKFLALDGKMRPTDCANTEGVLRLIMSVPSPKAEPFKLWLANLGKREIDETENPELGFERMRELYKAKGYTDEWITNRIKTIDTRKELTDEWKNRGVQEGQEYAILTATIAKGTFSLTPSEHKQHKGLTKPSQNLRDHMTPIELILTALGEEVTRMVVVEKDAQGFLDNHEAAVKGGEAGGIALKNVERITGKKVVSATNFLEGGGNDETPTLA